MSSFLKYIYKVNLTIKIKKNMKRLLLIIATSVAIAFSSLAQDTRGISFQGIARDASGNVIASKTLSVTFTIKEGVTDVYSEKQDKINTDMAGVFTTTIGSTTNTTVLIGKTFADIDFSKQYSINVSVTYSGGAAISIGTYALQSVPYAKFATSASNGVPVGTIVAYGGSTIPTGWKLCDGSTVYKKDYPLLFDAIGIDWGYGDNTTGSFNLPDMRGMFLRGASKTTTNDPDVSSRTAVNTGGNTGNKVGSLQKSAISEHKHQQRTTVKEWWGQKQPKEPGANGAYFYSDGYDGLTINSDGSKLIEGKIIGSNPTQGGTGANISQFYTIGVSGSDASTETRPINVAVYYIIKY